MGKKIDIVLVKPGGRLNLFGKLAPGLSGFAPPLDIGLVSAFLRENGFEIRVIDADAEFLTPMETAEKIKAFNPVLTGIFAHTIRMEHAGLTIKELRKIAPDLKILMGGRHPSSLPEKTLLEDNPDLTPAKMVEPDREIPGMIEKACVKPTQKDFRELSSAFPSLTVEVIKLKSPVRISANPTSLILEKNVSIVPLKRNPTKTAGMVAIRI